ncbi:MAG: aspartate aminotransferase family protein, partial [SAR86 cluster bacterium]
MNAQEEFQAVLQAAVQQAVQWRNEGPSIPAIPPASAAQLRELFDIGLPENGRDPLKVIQSLADAAVPGLVSNTHSNFFAWVMGSSDPLGVAADVLTSAWGQNSGMYQTAPSSAICEEIVSKWLLELLSLPPSCSMAFTSGATMASFICLAAARSEVLARIDYDLEQEGLTGAPAIGVFLGEQAHATILAGLRYLGFGSKQLIKIAVDDQGRMLANDLEAKITAFSGPKIIIAQAGHINSGAFDPFEEICLIARIHDAWVHVDGAFGLWAQAVPKLKSLCKGVEQADSWTVDGHKW